MTDHDSFKINELSSKWHWKSRDIGGVSALRFLIEVDGMKFTDAVKLLCEESPSFLPTQSVEKEKPPFKLPERFLNCRRIRAYLNHRGISDAVITYCISQEILYESVPYHNAVFVGKDESGKARYAFLRGIYEKNGKGFKMEQAGSEKKYSFCIPPRKETNRVAVYEACSGEALAGDKHFGLNFDVIGPVCDVIKKCSEEGCEIGIVVGGGNFWRGVKDGGGKMERTRADHMGMLATTINALALQDALEQRGVDVRVQTAIEMNKIAEPYIRSRATRHLEKGRVVIFGCGTGCPFFSTDTAAVLRAVEIGADVILLAKNVDGVYDSDPAVNPNAKKYDQLSYMDVLNQGLGVMDSTATSLSMDNHIPILVFALSDPENIYRAVSGEKIGTLVEEAK